MENPIVTSSWICWRKELLSQLKWKTETKYVQVILENRWLGDSLKHLESQVTSGAPQGSILAPLLFLIVIDGLTQSCLQAISIFFRWQ